MKYALLMISLVLVAGCNKAAVSDTDVAAAADNTIDVPLAEDATPIADVVSDVPAVAIDAVVAIDAASDGTVAMADAVTAG